MQPEKSNSSKPLPKSFLDLLVIEKPLKYKFKKYKVKKYRNDMMSYEVDDQTKFRNSTSYARSSNAVLQNMYGSSKNNIYKTFMKRKHNIKEIETQYKKVFAKDLDSFDIETPFDIVEWENNIIYDDEKLNVDKEIIDNNLKECDIADFNNLNNKDSIDDNVIIEKKLRTVVSPLIKEFVDSTLEEDWDKYVIFDDEIQTKFKAFPTLYLDDPNLIFDKIDDKKVSKSKKRNKEYFSGDKPIKSKYNISNDKYYNLEMKPRSSLGSYGVQHSLPALKLEPKFYKTNHSKEELRDFHRPPLIFPCNQFIHCKKLTSSNISTSNIIKKMSDLTLKDSSEFVLFEYSEEMPPFIVNCGMVSLINNYYRKMSHRDDYESDQTNLTILDPDDPSPFFCFGEIKPGVSMKSLTNNLFTAPIFQHKNSDYLCILDNNVIYPRKISNIFCVGQEFPLEEIYAPHSRKLNIFCKNRLKVAAYRLFAFKEDGLKEFKMSQLDHLFPYFSEGSKRKWLKEYADCIKRGKETLWILKPSSSILNEEDLRKLVTPENICQYESMLASERRLEDQGYKYIADSQEEEDESVYVIPWQLTRNFTNACNGKGLLELEGPADPTGIGEGFSFRKIKLIKGNEAENRKIISEHQAKYKSEIDKIWNKQVSSLSNTKEIPFDKSYFDEFEKKDLTQEINQDLKKSTLKKEKKKTAQEKNNDKKEEIIKNVLIIKRTFIDQDMERTETEKITDPKIIKMYLKIRKTIKFDDKKSALKCGNCGQSGHMKTNKFCPNFIQSKKPTKKKIDHERKRAKNIFHDIMLKLITDFFSIAHSIAFHRPVSTKKFPDYLTIVQNPIDLTTIKTKIRHNKYIKFQEFIDDLILMRDNCMKYNGAEHSLTAVAQKMVDMAYEQFEIDKDKIEEAENIFMEFTLEENETH